MRVLQSLPLSAWDLLLEDAVLWVLCKLGSSSLKLKPSYSQLRGDQETGVCGSIIKLTTLTPSRLGPKLCYHMLMHLCTKTDFPRLHMAHPVVSAPPWPQCCPQGQLGAPWPSPWVRAKRSNKRRAARPPLATFTPRSRLLATRTLLSVLGAGLRHTPIPCFSCMGV